MQYSYIDNQNRTEYRNIRQYKNKLRYNKIKNKEIYRAKSNKPNIILILGISVIAMILICFSLSSVGNAKQEHSLNVYYDSVQIKSGDTLTGIADSYYVEESGDFDKYVEEIRNLNNISGDMIHAGQYLTVKYYKTGMK